MPSRTATSRFAAFALALALPAAALAAPRLGDDVVPVAQRIDLEVDPARTDFRGSVAIDLEVRRPAAAVRFHAQDLRLERVELTGGGGGERWALAPAVGERGLVTAAAPRPLAPGRYTLEIDFAGAFNPQAVGLYRVEQAGHAYAFTQFQAVDARRAFPCWDEPAFKLPYTLRLRVPAGLVAVANTPVAADVVADGWRTVEFAPTPPLPSYLLALAVGAFERAEIAGLSVPGAIYAPAGQGGLTATAAAMTPPILAALERYFGRPYPFAKLDLIAVPEFWPGAMENAGAITFADRILLVDPRAVTAGQRQTLARFLAHELAHMWFGDLVTMAWWDDLWLNESFADWLATKIVDEVHPELGYGLSALGGIQGIMTTDARPSTPPIRKPVTDVSEAMEGLGVAYAKGRAVLAMVEAWVGPEAFRRGVLAHLAAHEWGNAAAADLWRALAEASGADVAGALESFVAQPGLPLIEVEVGAGGKTLHLRQRRFLNAGTEAPAQRWKVPVALAVGTARGREDRWLLLTGAEATLALDSPIEWVLPNAGARGYYRWRLPAPRLVGLARDAAGALTPAERIGLLGNTAALLDSGALAGDAYLETLHAFAADPDPAVVAAVVDGLGKVEQAFVPEPLAGAFAGYVRATLGPALERFGAGRSAGEPETVSLLRPRLLAWLGDEGRDAEVRRRAVGWARGYLEDPGALDPTLAGMALHLAARDGDRELFESYRRRFESSPPAERARFLGALGAFDDPELQAAALDYARTGPLRANELFNIAGSIADSEAGRERVYAWTVAHYAELTGRIPPDFVAFMPFIAAGCSEDRLARAEAFFARTEHRVEGTERQLARVAEQVRDCAALRLREGPAVAAYLERFAAGEG